MLLFSFHDLERLFCLRSTPLARLDNPFSGKLSGQLQYLVMGKKGYYVIIICLNDFPNTLTIIGNRPVYSWTGWLN